MTEISYTNTVNVNLSATPRGMSDFIVNNICLFTNETAGFADEYKVYVGASTVAKDFGSDSLTAKMANAIFAQSPNLRSGKGSLIIAPYVATNAKSGSFTTVSLADKLQNFKTVTDGEFNAVIDGTVKKLDKLDFSAVKSVADIVKVINSRNADMFAEVVDENKIKFISKRVGEDSSVSLTKVADGEGTDITTIAYFGAASGTGEVGTNAVDGEKLSDAVDRINSKYFFGGILDTCWRENKSIIDNAKAIEAISKKVYIAGTASLTNGDILAKAITQGGYKKTRVVAYSMDSLEDAKCAFAAYLSKACCTNYSGSDTCITMNLKELATIAPDENCGNDTLAKARANGFDIYGLTSGLGCVYSTKSAGGYMDDQMGQAAFVGALEVRSFNYLKQTNTKAPQTEASMTGLKTALAKVCEQFVDNGFIAPGTWNSSEKFGSPEDFDRNIKELGYYIYSLPIAQQPQSERENREAPLIQIAAKSAGALHIVNINGTIEA